MMAVVWHYEKLRASRNEHTAMNSTILFPLTVIYRGRSEEVGEAIRQLLMSS
jgi:hypothetical protein